MRALLLLALLATACQAAPVATAQAARGIAAASVSGDVRHLPGIASRHLAARRDVWVWLPPGYENATSRYPVLYMHDGNNLFDPAVAFGGHEWRVDESMTKLVADGTVPPMIVVGVGNTPDRLDEYTWLESGGRGGKGADYARFLVDELKPLIDKRFRTKPGATDTGVMGSSLGGLESAYLGVHEAKTFSKIGVLSPSVWWADQAVVEAVAKTPRTQRVWLDFGRREGDEPEASFKQAEALRDAYTARGVTLRWHDDPVGGHDEAAWAYRFPLAVTWLFGR